MRQITVQDDGVTITVSAANVRMGAKRALLRNAGMESLTSETMSDAEKVLAFAVYPDLISAAVEYQGMTEPSFDAFCELPETLFNPWMEAVYSLNPHWQMTPAQIDEAEKKNLIYRRRLIGIIKPADEEEAPQSWINPDESYGVWVMVRATEWRHLPYPGGLMDQPEWLMHDLLAFDAELRRLEGEIHGR